MGFSLTHRGLYFHCSPSLCHMRTNSRIPKAAHRHTCSEPDLYLPLSPVSLGTPCPAHMIAPFPGPLLPAFTLFPWQLSLKWVKPMLSAKGSFPKNSGSGNQLLAISFSLLQKVFKVSALFPLSEQHTPTFHPPHHAYCTYTHTHTHPLTYASMLMTTHTQKDSCFGWLRRASKSGRGNVLW